MLPIMQLVPDLLGSTSGSAASDYVAAAAGADMNASSAQIGVLDRITTSMKLGRQQLQLQNVVEYVGALPAPVLHSRSWSACLKIPTLGFFTMKGSTCKHSSKQCICMCS
jgi:hypothetical protein